MSGYFQMAVRMNEVSSREIMDRFFKKKPNLIRPAEGSKVEDEKEVITIENMDEAEVEEDPTQHVLARTANLAIIRRIPPQFHSSHLRRFFADYVEEDKFACFHFRHRPETMEAEKASSQIGSASTSKTSKERAKNLTTCCIVQFASPENRADFIDDFHGRVWEDEQGRQIPRKCAVFPIKVAEEGAPSTSKDVSSNSDKLTAADLRELIELRPPEAMPKGNVGTPSAFFLDQIRLCKLPSSLVGKLGLRSVRRRRKYDSVPMDYGHTDKKRGKFYYATEQIKAARMEEQGREATRMQEDAPEDPTDKAMRDNYEMDNDDHDHKDEDECEEWERHEALHDDVTEHERVKERKYEEEMEVTWEKGGSGLVWESDKNKWDEIEKGTDCDWAWADDWDVDYSVYYEGRSGGDVDSRAAVEMREDEAKRKGDLVESVFRSRGGRGRGGMRRERRNSEGGQTDVEKYTRRVGSSIMHKMGWKEGGGLGRAEQGRVAPVAVSMHDDGQTGREKKGLGFYGEKMQRFGLQKRREEHGIKSVYDDKEEKEWKRNEKGEVLFRRPDKTADNIRLVRSSYTTFALPSSSDTR